MRSVWYIMALALAAVGCSDASNPVFSSGSLVVNSISVSSNLYNALSFNVAFNATDGDSAQVQYVGTGDSSQTPWTKVTSGHNGLVVLGLLPTTFYRITLVVQGPSGYRVSPHLTYTTGALPSDLADAHIAYTGTPGPGYTLISPIEATGVTNNTFAMAFDTAGRVRWYREFTGWQSLDVQMQTNSHYTVGLNYLSNSTQQEIGPFVELLPSGDSLATYIAPSGFATDGHEIVLSGSTATGEVAQFYAYDTVRTENLTSIGGPSTAQIYGHSLFRIGPGGVQFAWDAWNYYGLNDWTEAANNGFTGDFDHPNALSFDVDSNYIMSFRNMDAVVKLDRMTGARIWQIGGTQATMTFVNDPLGGFSGQHFARRLSNGHLLLYDDGLRHSPQTSRAVEYAIDTVGNTATMVWQYLPTPAVFTLAVGSAQRLTNGNTVVGFGFAAQIDEVDANAKLLSRGMFKWTGAKAFYRALRLPSLYQYETP
jgi:hypothetical protein